MATEAVEEKRSSAGRATCREPEQPLRFSRVTGLTRARDSSVDGGPVVHLPVLYVLEASRDTALGAFVFPCPRLCLHTLCSSAKTRGSAHTSTIATVSSTAGVASRGGSGNGTGAVGAPGGSAGFNAGGGTEGGGVGGVLSPGEKPVSSPPGSPPPGQRPLSPPPPPLPPPDKCLQYPGDAAFATRLVACVRAKKGEWWARCECRDYTQGLLNLALDRETGLADELASPDALNQVSGDEVGGGVDVSRVLCLLRWFGGTPACRLHLLSIPRASCIRAGVAEGFMDATFSARHRVSR